jgi:hypothetical protein
MSNHSSSEDEYDYEEEEDEEEDYESIPESLENEMYEISSTVDSGVYAIAYTFIYQETQYALFEHQIIHRVSPFTFFKYTTENLEYYLEYYSFYWTYYYAPDSPHIRIIQINHIEHADSLESEYQVVDKTFWLRLVQRIWKRKYAEKLRLQRARGSLQNQRHFELHGRYLPGYNHLSILPLF